MSDKTRHFYEFEEFRLDAETPALWRAGELVPISPKALETLVLLVEKKGEIVTREELLETVWRDTFVEDGNINYTVSLLRKTLGNKDLIQTVPRRGYRFQCEVKTVAENENIPPIQPSAAKVELLSAAQPPVAQRREHKKRPMLFTAAMISVLLMLLFAFSWRGGTNDATARTGAPSNAESLRAYKRGMMILGDRDVQNREQKAIDEFQRAVTLDPTSALAYTGLAEGLASRASAQPDEKSVELYSKAKTAAEKAFSLDENLFEAFLIRGWLRRNADWDWDGAERDFCRAIELNPESAVAHYRYSHLLANTGRHREARAAIKRAARLDPLSEIIMSGHFPLLESAGEYDEALRLAEEYLQSNAENPHARRALATFQYHTGDYLKVIEHAETALANGGRRRPFAWLSLLAASYHKIGQTDKADETLRELEIQSHADKKALYSLAMNYAELGRLEEAAAALEKCFEAREQRIMWINTEPRFANLKNEPGFQKIVADMRLN